jgi:hypothetical protein
VWVLAGVVNPKSEWALDPGQSRAFCMIAVGMLLAGVAMVLWKTWCRVIPSEWYIEQGCGFWIGSGSRLKAPDSLWIQEHPIRITVRRSLAWSGHAVVIHVTVSEGFVAGVAKDEAGATDCRDRIGQMLKIGIVAERGAPLSATA